MKLITKVSIEAFRSIQKAENVELSDMTAFAGLNNSGKSNVLRALHAFFVGSTEPDVNIDVDLDYHRQDLKKKKRKRIAVTVHFELPNTFVFRSELELVKQLLGGNQFSITKEWRRKDFELTYLLNDQAVKLEDVQKVNQFLSLINFRYIENRVTPVSVIRDEHNNLRDVLIRRLAKRAKQDRATFDAIQSKSSQMMQSLSERFNKACPLDGEVRLATPSSWKDMVFAFGYKLSKDGIEIEDYSQGSGIQSLLMLETLYLVDKANYFQQFGWKQATIWAIEEPESSLHNSLEARVANFLSAISSDPANKLQILCTTHSDLMVQYSNKIIEAQQNDGKSSFTVAKDPRSALESLSRAGISRWVHPLMYHPLDSIVIVDGEYDLIFWQEAMKLLKLARIPIITCLQIMDPDAGSGGNKTTFEYVKNHSREIKARHGNAKVKVVLDWEDKSFLDRYNRIFKASDPFVVHLWSENSANPQLGKTFRGTERFYSERIIRQAIDNGFEAVFNEKTNRFIVETQHYNKFGKKIISEIVKKGLQEDDLVHSKEFITHVLA